MFGAILKATNSSFQKGMTCCRSIYVKKVMKLLAFIFEQPSYYLSGRVAQSVTCLATDASLTADPGVASLIPAQSHTFVEIDHEIISA